MLPRLRLRSPRSFDNARNHQPEVEGFTYAEALAVVRRTIARNELVGFDLVELAPNLDSSGLSSLVGARLLAEVLAVWGPEMAL